MTCVLANPCMNGATCTEVDPNSADVNCTCPVGFTGANCETGKSFKVAHSEKVY